MMAHVLVLNAGSSSLKFGLFTAQAEPQPLATGLVDRIGGAARMVLKDADGTRLHDADLTLAQARDHRGALQTALRQIETRFPAAQVQAVGHRIVHGGQHFTDPADLTPDVMAELETLVPFAPLHQPHNLAGVRAAMGAFPQARQVACFDTAFHRSHPFVNDTFALPRRYYDKGVRRYGFHGLSYDYIAGTLARTDPALHAGRVVVAHLGNGASMCGMRAGRSVDSTMGFSALDGLPMGTRTGQLDPGVMLYMLEQEGLDAGQITDLLYRQSGLLGLSGLSHDMRTLLASDEPHAAQAIAYFTFRIRRELGALAATLQGLDALVFTGGIGENAAPVRQAVCDGMDWIGIDLDPAANDAHAAVISQVRSRVRVMVIPTNEELIIARAAASRLGDPDQPA